MKKLLLSLGLLSATLFVNAQQFLLWNPSPVGGAPYTDVTGSPFPFSGSALTVDTAATAPRFITVTGSTASYYAGGFGVGSYAAGGIPQPWFGKLTGPMLGYSLYIEFKTVAPGAIVQILFNSKDSVSGGNYQAQKVKLDLSAGTTSNTADGYQLYTVPLSTFQNGIGPNGDPASAGNYMTESFADSIHQMQFSVNTGVGSGTGTADFQLGRIWVSKSSVFLSTQAQVAANISSTVIYPNPAANTNVSALISLQNASQVTTIVTDLTGRQVATNDLGTVPATAAGSNAPSYTLFNSAGYAKGMYTVTYVINGTSAKTDLVVVQ